MDQEFYSEVNSVTCGLGELARTSSIRNSFRRQRDPIWIQNVRLQLAEQAKCLESRLDNHVSMLKELFDFFKKRAEVERDYSNSMDKLVQQALNRHEREKQRHEVWPGYSTYTMWQTFLETTRKLSKDHQTLADIYGGQLYPQLTELSEDLQRMYKKCRTFLTISHEDLVRVLTDLQSAMKTYQEYQSQCFEAETKLKRVQTQKLKLEQIQTRHSKSTNKRKFQSLEKQTDKKRTKFSDCHLRVVRSRNEYILNLASANSALQKYFSEDIHNEINTMDYGYHFILSQIAMTQISAEQNMIDSRQGCLQILKQKVKNLEQPKDKQIFIDLFPRQFSVPDKFEFHAHKGDNMMKELIVENSLMKDEMNQRMKTLQNRLDSLESENEEVRICISIFYNFRLFIQTPVTLTLS
jgi:SLIT-ROBO Rho GTPase activating protein